MDFMNQPIHRNFIRNEAQSLSDLVSSLFLFGVSKRPYLNCMVIPTHFCVALFQSTCCMNYRVTRLVTVFSDNRGSVRCIAESIIFKTFLVLKNRILSGGCK